MLGLLLAKQGVDVVVVEKASSYAREFRGENITQQSVSLLDELGLLSRLREHGYLETHRMEVSENGQCLLKVDFDDFPHRNKYAIDLPQPVLLGALVDEARQYPSFRFLNGLSCQELIRENGRVVGVQCRRRDETVEIRSQLVVAADGRYSRIRKLAELEAVIRPLRRDVIWFRVPRPDTWGNVVRINIRGDHNVIILPTYPDTLRVGFSIPTGGYKEVRAKNIEYLHDMVDALEPRLGPAVREHIRDWSDTTLLDVFTAEVPTWSIDGLVLIGDAAHTLSPILGQGVNHALKDAVILAPIVAASLRRAPGQPIPLADLRRFEKVRRRDVRFIHGFQVRQEVMFGFSGAASTAVRRTFYRVLNSARLVKTKLWERLIFQAPKLELEGA